jgi:hypothetical protein
MKKILLNVEALSVESFVAGAEAADTRGTVHGHATGALRCNTAYYCTLGYATCFQGSCVDTCGYPYAPAC